LLAKYMVTGHCHQNTYLHFVTLVWLADIKCGFTGNPRMNMVFNATFNNISFILLQSMMISKLTTQTVKYLISNFHAFTSIMMTSSKHSWYLVLKNPETNDNSLTIIITVCDNYQYYIKTSYIMMKSDLFFPWKREKNAIFIILTLDWTPEMQDFVSNVPKNESKFWLDNY
jgi:hypothetical protein